MKEKKVKKAIKKRIRKGFQEYCRQKGIEARIVALLFEDGVWHASWVADLPFPEGFDTSIRTTAFQEIRPYVEEKYDEMIPVLREFFGEIEHDKGSLEYNFTFAMPPKFIAVPETWEWVWGEFRKTRDARLLTEEELDDLSRHLKEEGKNNKWAELDFKTLEWERANWRKYFEFVGGSCFTDELFVITNYFDIRLYGKFSFKAFGDYIPLIPSKAKRDDVDDQLFIEMLTTKILVELNVSGCAVSAQLVPLEEFRLKEKNGVPYLYLGDISAQLTEKFKENLSGIFVWEESDLRGYIYRYDMGDQKWRKHGETKGYA